MLHIVHMWDDDAGRAEIESVEGLRRKWSLNPNENGHILCARREDCSIQVHSIEGRVLGIQTKDAHAGRIVQQQAVE